MIQKSTTAGGRVKLLAEAKWIDLVGVERGKYFRLVGRIVADGQDISKLLLKNRYARPYHGEKRKGWC